MGAGNVYLCCGGGMYFLYRNVSDTYPGPRGATYAHGSAYTCTNAKAHYAADADAQAHSGTNHQPYDYHEAYCGHKADHDADAQAHSTS